nr:Agno [Scorpion polyomavirus 3]QTH80102.1 Agno [Scorpion polyomavirus 3]
MTYCPTKSFSIGCRCCLNPLKAPAIVGTAEEILDTVSAILEDVLNFQWEKRPIRMSHSLCSAWRYNYFLRINPSKADYRWLLSKVSKNGGR